MANTWYIDTLKKTKNIIDDGHPFQQYNDAYADKVPINYQ